MGAPAFAQVNTGRILGTVTDQSGGAVAGAGVTVTNSQTGVARNLTADAAAEYLAPNLNPGTYTVRCTATGFQMLSSAKTSSWRSVRSAGGLSVDSLARSHRPFR